MKSRLLLFVVLVLLVQACTVPGAAPVVSQQVEEAPTSVATLPPVKLTIMMQCCYLSDSGFLIAQEEGYFARQGLEIEVLRYNNSAEGLAAVLSGQVDILGGGIDPGILNAMARGENLKLVADKGRAAADCDYIGALVRKEDLPKWQAGDPAALKLLKVAASGNQTGSFYAETVLQQIGLSFADMEVVDVPAPSRGEALISGGVDFALVAEPYLTQYTQDDQAVVFKPAAEILPEMQISVWVFGKKLLEENRDLGQRFITAYMEGVRKFHEGKTDSNISSLAKGTKLEPDLVRDVCWPGLAETGVVDHASIQQYQEWLLSKGWLDETVDESQYWDGGFVEQAIKILSGQGQ